MTLNEYQQKAMRTAGGLSREQMILNGAMGMCGEAGEVIDAIKKTYFQGHEFNATKLCEEAGDVLWYIAVFLSGLGISLKDCAEANVEKLLKRYPNGFETNKSVNRE